MWQPGGPRELCTFCSIWCETQSSLKNYIYFSNDYHIITHGCCKKHKSVNHVNLLHRASRTLCALTNVSCI